MDLLVRAGTLTSGIRALDLRGMANKKSGGGNPNAQNQTVAKASHLELDFQVLREETAAQLVSLQDSVTNLQGSMAEVQKTVSSINVELLAEMRLLLLETRPVQTATVPDLVPSVDSSTEAAQISFGNLQEVADVITLPTKETPALPAIVASYSELNLATAHPKGPVTTSATTVAAANVDSATKGSSSKLMPLVSEPNKYRELSPHEVILGLNSERTATMTPLVSDVQATTIDSSVKSGSYAKLDIDDNVRKKCEQGNGSIGNSVGPSTHHYFQHKNFGTNPFNYMTGPFTVPHPNFAQHTTYSFAPTTHVSTVEPSVFQLPYYAHPTYPYPIPPTPTSLPPNSMHNSPYSAYTTVHSNHVYPPHPLFGAQLPNGAWLQGYTPPSSTHYPHLNPILPVQPNSQFCQQQTNSPQFCQQQPNCDPTLPTMNRMRLEFANFSGGDPVEWLNKAEQFFEFYQVPDDRKLAIGTMHLTEKASVRALNPKSLYEACALAKTYEEKGLVEHAPSNLETSKCTSAWAEIDDLGDIHRASVDKILPHCDGIMMQFLNNLSSNQLLLYVKPQTVSCLGDLVLIMMLYYCHRTNVFCPFADPDYPTIPCEMDCHDDKIGRFDELTAFPRPITYQVIGRLAEPMPSLLRISTACASVETKYFHHFQLVSTYVSGVTTSQDAVFVFVCWDHGTYALITYSEVTNGYTIPTVDLRCITDRADTFGMHGFSIPGPFGHHRVWINDTIGFSRQLENLEAPFLSEQEVLHQLITSDLSRGTAETVMQHTTTCLKNVALLLGLWLLTLTEEIRKLLILVYSYPCQLTSYCLSILLSAIGKWMHGVDWMINTVKVHGMVSTAAFLAQSRPEDMPCSKGGGMLGLLG